MNMKILAAGLFTSLVGFYGCCGDCKNPNTANTQTAVPKVIGYSSTVGSAKTDTIANKKGELLLVTYDTTGEKATIVFNNDKVEISRQRTASGVTFANKQFEFTEWHGEKTLKKDGKLIFSNQ